MPLVDVRVPLTSTCMSLYTGRWPRRRASVGRRPAPCRRALAGYTIRIAATPRDRVPPATGSRIWRIAGQIGSASRDVRIATAGAPLTSNCCCCCCGCWRCQGEITYKIVHVGRMPAGRCLLTVTNHASQVFNECCPDNTAHSTVVFTLKIDIKCPLVLVKVCSQLITDY